MTPVQNPITEPNQTPQQNTENAWIEAIKTIGLSFILASLNLIENL